MEETTKVEHGTPTADPAAPDIVVGPPVDQTRSEPIIALGPPIIIPPSSPSSLIEEIERQLDTPPNGSHGTSETDRPNIPVIETKETAAVEAPKAQKPSSPILGTKRLNPKTKRRRNSFTLEECMADAKRFESKTQWQFLSGRTYTFARKKGWLSKCSGHMSKKRNRYPHGYWTKERVAAIAKEFKSRTMWAAHSNASYNFARVKGWLDELTKHMPKYLVAINVKRAVKPVRAAKSKTDKPSVKALPNTLTKHSPFLKKPHGYWDNKENVLECAKKFKTRTQWALMAETSYRSAVKNGWVAEATAHMTKTKSAVMPPGYWTKKRCREIALKYTRRIDWAAFHPSSYNAARRNGWIGSLCAHMAIPTTGRRSKPKAARVAKTKAVATPKATPTAKTAQATTSTSENDFAIQHAEMMGFGYWTKPRVLLVAKRYGSRKEWRDATPFIYKVATKRGWLKHCTRHMADALYMRYERGPRKSNTSERFKPSSIPAPPEPSNVENLSQTTPIIPPPAPVAPPVPVTAQEPVVASPEPARPVIVERPTVLPQTRSTYPARQAERPAPAPAPQPGLFRRIWRGLTGE